MEWESWPSLQQGVEWETWPSSSASLSLISALNSSCPSAVAVYTEKSSERRGFYIRFVDAIEMLRTRNTTATSCIRA